MLMTQQPPSPALFRATLILAVFPLLLLAAFLGYVIEARLSLGYWPSYDHPDPKNMGWWIQHNLLFVGFMGFPVTSLLAVELAVMGRLCSRDFPFCKLLAAVIASILGLILFLRADPGGFVVWYCD